MPKMKSHSGTAKRIKLTGGGKRGGKLKRRRAYVSHLLEHKSVARKRAKHGVDDLAKADTRRARKLLAGGAGASRRTRPARASRGGR